MSLKRAIKSMSKIGSKILFEKEDTSSEKVEVMQISSTDIVTMMLKRLINKGEYNKAENIIFEELEENSSKEMYEIAVDFYNLLLEKSDEELIKCYFSREEIYHGLEDIKKFKV